MIEGCLEWQAEGLCPPARVRDATAEYLAEQDTFTSWLGECCDVRHDAWDTSATLFGSWSAWAERQRVFVGNSKTFAEAMKKHGFRSLERNAGRGWLGLSLEREGSLGSPTSGAPY